MYQAKSSRGPLRRYLPIFRKTFDPNSLALISARRQGLCVPPSEGQAHPLTR